jgi:CheY-like chemotaxis protein
MVAAGMTLPAVLDLAERLRVHVDAAAHDMAATVAGHVVAAHLRDGALPGKDVAEAAAIIRRLRPLAQIVLDAMLAQAMSRHVQQALGDHLAHVLDQPGWTEAGAADGKESADAGATGYLPAFAVPRREG